MLFVYNLIVSYKFGNNSYMYVIDGIWTLGIVKSIIFFKITYNKYFPYDVSIETLLLLNKYI